MIKNNKKISQEIIDMLDDSMIEQEDLKNNNLLMYAIKYKCTVIFDSIIKKYNNLGLLLCTRNIHNKSPLLYATKYNSNLVKKILNFNISTSNILNNGYEESALICNNLPTNCIKIYA